MDLKWKKGNNIKKKIKTSFKAFYFWQGLSGQKRILKKKDLPEYENELSGSGKNLNWILLL